MSPYVFLAISIASELFGTSMLKMSEGFSKLLPSIGVIIGFGSSFYFFSITLQHIPLSIGYAIWAGVGTAATALIGVLVWKETMTVQTVLGIVFIIIGVVLLNIGKATTQ